jgi:hypothetical protein
VKNLSIEVAESLLLYIVLRINP